MSKSSPHIVHVITRYLPRGGAERNTKHTMRFLAEEGVEVTLITGRNSDTDHLAGEPFDVLTSEHLVNHVDPAGDTLAVVELQDLFQSLRADVVHTHQGKAGLVGRIAAILAGVPRMIYGLHGDHVEHPKLNALTRPVYRCFEQFLGRFTDHFVSVGREIQWRYLRRGIGTPDQHTVIPSGMELDNFLSDSFETEAERSAKKRELGVDDPDALIVGMVASLEPRKGYDDALAVARMMLENETPPGLKFLFVGNGPLRSELEETVAEKKLDDNVIFTGYREDVAEVMACFDVFMFTSHMEGLPQVLVQAAATGLPVVTFDVEGARESIRNGRSGYVLDARDRSEMVRRLTELLTDPELRAEFGRAGRDHVDERWSFDYMETKVKRFYRTVLSDLVR